ncbi:MAG: leucine-rich repeat domain-containing protein [Bacteroidetes bacterium]|nr:leucine-rich repeat domain-containing protein [Bacteroidota bacterium]
MKNIIKSVISVFVLFFISTNCEQHEQKKEGIQNTQKHNSTNNYPRILNKDFVQLYKLKELNPKHLNVKPYMYLYSPEEKNVWNFDTYDLRQCLSVPSGDTTIIYLSKGYDDGYRIQIRLLDSSYYISLFRYMERRFDFYYKSLFQDLAIYPINRKTDDTVWISLKYRGYAYDSIYDKKMQAVIVSGRFKTIIHNKNYTLTKAVEERDSTNFMYQFTTNRPDTVTELYCLKCGITRLPEQLKKFRNLKSLHFRANDFRYEDFHVLGYLQNLEELGLAYCRIEEFPIVVKKLKKLKRLNLDGNHISFIPKEVIDMNSLQELYLSQNSIYYMPKDIYNMKKLQMLDLTYNEKLDSVQILKDNNGKIKKIIF